MKYLKTLLLHADIINGKSDPNTVGNIFDKSVSLNLRMLRTQFP